MNALIIKPGYRIFSGHTSFTAAISFYFAKVMNDYHPQYEKPVIKLRYGPISAAIPAATGYLRVKGGASIFTTDAISGYVFGAFVGWLIPELHKKRIVDKKVVY